MVMQGAAPTRHVAVVTFPLSSHPSAMLDLARGIADSAPTGTVFSFFNSNSSNAKLFRDVDRFRAIRRFDVDYGFVGGPSQVEVASYQRLAPESLRGAVRRAEEEVGLKVTCLLTDSFVWFAGEMAEEMGIPWIAFRTAGASLLMVLLEIDSVRARLGTTELEHKTLDIIPGLSSIRGNDIPSGFMSKAINDPFTFPNMLYKMSKELHRATVVPVNSFHDLESSAVEQMQAKSVRAMCIGPQAFLSPPPVVDKYDCLPWLDQQKLASVVYISFGTEATLSVDEIRELIEGLEETGYPYLWSYRGEDGDDRILKGFKLRTVSQGKIVSWVPQLEVLKHPSVGVFVTHCGWKSLLESLASGVPLIGRPFFGDQPFNAGMMERMLRVGVGVEGGVFTKRGVTKALRTVLKSGEGKAMRERAGELKSAALKGVSQDGDSARNYRELVQIVCGNDPL